MTEEKYTLEEAQRKFAIKTNGQTWSLLEKESRTKEDDKMLLLAAQASLYHWLQAGTGVHHFRGLYMIAKAHIALGNAEEALQYAEETLELTRKYGEEAADFDWCFAYELMARASAMNENKKEFSKYHQMAEEVLEKIGDEEDKKICISDLAAGPWFGMK